MRFNPFGLLARLARWEVQRIENREFLNQTEAARVIFGESLHSGRAGTFRIREGNFNTWIRGLETDVEVKRFEMLIDREKNAPEKLEFRRKIGILNWMEAVEDYKEND